VPSSNGRCFHFSGRNTAIGQVIEHKNFGLMRRLSSYTSSPHTKPSCEILSTAGIEEAWQFETGVLIAILSSNPVQYLGVNILEIEHHSNERPATDET
jgi:hypothetical protein